MATRSFARVLDTGNSKQHTALLSDRRKPLRLDTREERFKHDQTLLRPTTTLLIINHVFHEAKQVQALHIHLKYGEESGDTHVMYRTKAGLMRGTTINNSHWIRYVMMHAVGTEDVETAGEGEFRLEVVTDKDGEMHFTCNIVYLHDGVKLTLSPIHMS
eukprot:TRINITY_DN2976_c0_g2_i2.p1 TRINITY_DN2976_c0_g2~~TRINITY_DN2976_c0_g2_i2.p1  ORF type:complete len:168 (+),score=28.05 TRINITY_DN2976_c0_g2_i2:29-505(+)